ncbi:hypothetical protein KKF84_11715 [Myxococcota bacterium]|nr:hypothetical protein [Myxococcota bacterium]MBU1535980.1 hypothetical protein [Myxococcota bacterium]
MRHFISTLLLVLPLFYLASCTEERVISISSPERGSMFTSDELVTLEIKGGKNIHVNDEPSDRTVILDPVDGLGFVKASIPGDPLFDVRSYIQGTLLDKTIWVPETMQITLGPDSLSTGGNSVARIISTLLTDEDLEPFVENPLAMDISTMLGTVTVNVTVTSVISPSVAITLSLEGDRLMLSGTLSEVLIHYTAQATGISSSGTAYYETITVNGEVNVAVDGALLLNATTTTSAVEIQDSGGLPAAGVESLATLFDEEISDAVISAAENATSAVFSHLINNLKPNMGISFSKPVVSQSRPEQVTVSTAGLTITYSTLIEAQTPSVAGEHHRILSRTASPAAFNNELVATFGPRLINQYAFAIWDAGNMSAMSFTKGELEDMGMGELDFPYSNLDRADITLLLPPILEMTVDGPVMMLGGIRIELKIDAADDSTAWTAAQVPVLLTEESGALSIQADTSRDITIRDVGFNKMSDLVDQGKVLRLLLSAVPGVVDRVFGELPSLVISEIPFPRLDGSDGPTIIPAVNDMTASTSGWEITVGLVVTEK